MPLNKETKPNHDLKSAQMNMQHSLIWELYKFKLGYDAMEATKNNCMKGEGTV